MKLFELGKKLYLNFTGNEDNSLFEECEIVKMEDDFDFIVRKISNNQIEHINTINIVPVSHKKNKIQGQSRWTILRKV